MNLNKAMIIGNLTRNPETRTTPTGQTVTSFDVATNRAWTNAAGQRQEEVEYHHVVAWGKLAEICQQYLSKGRKVYVEGRLRTHDWVGQDGAKHNRTEIIADNMIMLDRAGAAAPAERTSTSPAPAESVPAEAASTPAGDEEIKVEDLPF